MADCLENIKFFIIGTEYILSQTNGNEKIELGKFLNYEGGVINFHEYNEFANAVFENGKVECNNYKDVKLLHPVVDEFQKTAIQQLSLSLK